MRLIMMGTGPFAVPTFQQLYEARHDVALLVTRPLRSHRGKEVEPASAMRDIAHEHATPIYDPENINTAEAQQYLSGVGADLLVVCDYGQILAPQTLSTARLGGINLHGSLLPKYRGAAPINWALLNGDTETGVTVIHMTPKVDAGPCIAQAVTMIDPEETAVDVGSKARRIGRLAGAADDRRPGRGPSGSLAAKSGLGLQSAAAEEDRRGHRLVPAGLVHQEPGSRPGAVAADLYLLASRAGRRGPHDPGAGRCRRFA